MSRKKTQTRLKRDAERNTYLAIGEKVEAIKAYDRKRLTQPRQWCNHTDMGKVEAGIAELKLGYSKSSVFDQGRTFDDNSFSNNRSKTGRKIAKPHKVGVVVRSKNGFKTVYDNPKDEALTRMQTALINAR